MITSAMTRPKLWKASSASSWLGWGFRTPTWPARETMTDPDPSSSPPASNRGAPTAHKGRGVLSLFDRFRRGSGEPDRTPDPPTAATGRLVSQARAFQDLRIEDVMQPRADIVAVEKSCSFAELTARFVEAE